MKRVHGSEKFVELLGIEKIMNRLELLIGQKKRKKFLNTDLCFVIWGVGRALHWVNWLNMPRDLNISLESNLLYTKMVRCY